MTIKLIRLKWWQIMLLFMFTWLLGVGITIGLQGKYNFMNCNAVNAVTEDAKQNCSFGAMFWPLIIPIWTGAYIIKILP